MPYNIIHFQGGPNGHLPGWGEFVKTAGRMNIPVGIAVTDTTSGADDILAHGAPGSQINYRPTLGLPPSEMKKIDPAWESAWGRYPVDVPLMTIYPSREEAMAVYRRNAKLHVEVTLRLLPRKLPLSHPGVSISTWNEPAPYVGWGTEGKTETWTEAIPGFTGFADALGWQAYEVGRELIRRQAEGEPHFRWAAFAFSGGAPEDGVWEQPGMLAYLRLCEARPDLLGIALHEYSFTLDIERDFDKKAYIGRFTRLFDACDKHNIKRPFIVIKEWGWAERDIPHVYEAMQQLAIASAFYAKYPEVRLAAIWTTNGGWGRASERVPALASELYKYTLETKHPSPPATDIDDDIIYGINTSTTVGLERLKAMAVGFGYHRAISWARSSDGTRTPTIDPTLAATADAYHALNIPFGIFSQVYPALQEAGGVMLALIYAELKQRGMKLLPPAIAVENIPGEAALTPKMVRAFIDAFEGETGVKPVIYTSKHMWETVHPAPVPWARDYALWVAHYTDAPAPILPRDWDSWAIWQYTGDLQRSGVIVNMNRAKQRVVQTLTGSNTRRVHLVKDWFSPVANKALEEALPRAEPVVFTQADAEMLGGDIVVWEEDKPKPQGPTLLYHPCQSKVVTQPWGANPATYRQFGFPGHEGVDYAAALGSPFFAVADGVVVEDDDTMFDSDRKSNYGQHVIIAHEGGKWHSLYAHAAYDTPCEPGQNVRAGQVIAYSGNTGRSTGPHLHFSLLISDAQDNGYPTTRYGRYVDPSSYLVDLPIPAYKPSPPPPPYTDGWLWGKGLIIYDDVAELRTSLNFRSGPGVGYKLMTQAPLKAGTVVLVRGGEQDGYYPVAASVGGTIDLSLYMFGDGKMLDVQHKNGGTETFQYHDTKDGKKLLVKNQQWEEMWADDQHIWRGYDTSPGPAPKESERPGENRYYIQREDGQRGARWVKRHMRVGETFFGSGHKVQFYYKRDCAPSIVNSGPATNVVQLVAHHQEMTFFTGYKAYDVVHLHTSTGEDMHFARGRGLVAWKSQWGESAAFAIRSGPSLVPEKIGCMKM